MHRGEFEVDSINQFMADLLLLYLCMYVNYECCAVFCRLIGDNLRWPSAPSSAPVSPCHRARVPTSHNSTGKAVEDHKLRFPAAAVHSRGQSLDSTYSDVDGSANDESTTGKLTTC